MSNLVSKQCVDFVKGFEGFSATPYLDEVGVKTLGYGMTGEEIEGLTSVTEEQANAMLEDLINNKYAAPLKADLDSRGVELTQNQFDALVSMAYNVGVAGVLGSTLYRNICNGVRDKETITANFQMWSMAGGQRLEGLYRRRTEEAEMFFSTENNAETYTAPVVNYDPQVAALQKALNKLKVRDDDGCPLVEDGIPGKRTTQATKRLQSICGLEVDGIPGEHTWNAINTILSTQLCGLPYVQRIATRYIQWRLGISIDGIFGSGTATAVKAWQTANGLVDDGIVGNMSWSKLIG